MKLAATLFESTYHNSETCYSSTYNLKYIRHNVDVYNRIMVYEKDGVREFLLAVYQTGCTFLHNDYDLPNPELELSESGGTDGFLYAVNKLYERDFDDNEIIAAFLEQFKNEHVDTPEKLWRLYEFLRDNMPAIDDYTPEQVVYITDDESCFLARKGD